MSLLTQVLGVLALLGSALIAGVFFAFSSFIMKALARMPPKEGVAAMQAINVTVLRPSFLGVFMGTAILSLAIVAFSVREWSASAAPWMLAGAFSYLVGTFLVTGLGNVPLNNQLAAAPAGRPASATLWQRYLGQWTRLNTLRTIAAAAATLMFTIGLIKGAD